MVIIINEMIIVGIMPFCSMAFLHFIMDIVWRGETAVIRSMRFKKWNVASRKMTKYTLVTEVKQEMCFVPKYPLNN